MEEKATHQCKNCSTEIEGEYCHFCGQRYHDHKESFGELAYEFVSDFLHFDSRFFRTVLPLIFQPGKLTKNYNEGRQRSQFHPIRLYLFSSFVYFFLFFYFNNVGESFENKDNQNTATIIIDSAKNEIRKDSVIKSVNSILSSADDDESVPDSAKLKSRSNKKDHIVLQDPNKQFTLTTTPYIDSLLKKRVTPEQYLTQQKKLSKDKKAGYFARIVTLRLLKINLAGEEGKKEFFKKITETFFHNIPKMLFFLLPVFALFLKLLYYRKKQFYYVDHAILSLHYFSLIFLLLILSKYILDKIFGTGIFSTIAVYWAYIYLYIAMKRLYGQSWKKTLVKYFALGFFMSIAILITLLGNMAWSAFMMI